MFNIQLAKEEGNIGILRYAVALILATYPGDPNFICE